LKNRFPTGKFTLSIFLLLSFLFILVMPIQAKVNFSDIDGHWAESAIQKMADQGIVKGFPDGSFKPENSITRAEFATLIVQAFKLESKNGKVFSDTSQHWAKEFIATANAHGIVNGYNDSIFKPDNKISREEMAVMIVKAAKPQINSEFLECTDGDQVSSWAKNAVATAYVNNIITGMPDGSFLPLNNASRAEAVIVLNKGMQFILPASFMPAGNISANTSETASSVTSISIQSAPKKVSYTAGEKLDLSGLAVTLTKSDGSTENVALGDFAAKGITVSPANGAVLTTNDTAVVITVNGKTTSQKISVAALAAGGGGGGGGGGGAPTVAVAGVTLDQETLTLTVGGADGTLTATVAPANASNKKVSWTSSDEDVATVDNGVVTPVAAGAATITVTTEDGSFTDTCTVTVNDGGTTPTEPDKSDLKAAIDAANANANATKTSTDGTDVDPADKWVTQEDMNAYLAAIDSAQDVFDDPDATQEEIDAALADLQDAASAFDAAKAAGTKPAVTTDKSDLKDAIDAANANAAATEVSNDGSDIDPANKWVTQEDMNAYLDAIDSAQNVFDDPDATQEEIDAALADLQDATSAFNASKAAGTFDGGSDVTVENVTAEYRTSMVNWYRFDVIGDYNTVQIKTDDGTDLGPAMTEAAFEDAGYYQGGVAPNDIIVIYVDGVIAWSGEPGVYSGPVAVTGVTLDKETLTLTVGGADGTLAATITPVNASNKNVSWTSSDESVATVDNGIVTPVAAGTATITVTTEDGSFTDTCEVTVETASVVEPSISPASFDLNKNAPVNDISIDITWGSATQVNDVNLNVVTSQGSPIQLSLNDLEAAGNGKFYYVEGNVLTIKKEMIGLFDIFGYPLSTIPDGFPINLDIIFDVGQKTFLITIVDGETPTVAVTGVTLDKETLTLTVGGADGTLAATITPVNASNKNVSWTSSDESVATVDNGIVTPVAAGTATITVTTEDGSFTDTCEVTVETAPTQVTVENVTAESRTSLVNWYRFDVIGDYNTVQIKTDDGTDLGPAMTKAVFENTGYYQGGVAPNDIIVIYVDGVIAWSGEPKAYCTVENVTAESRTSLVNWYRFDVIGDYNEVMIKTTDGIDLGPVLSKSAFESVGYYQGGVSPDGIIVIYVDGVEKYRNVPGTYSSPIVTVTDVSIKTPPAKVTYFAGDALDLRGLAVTLYKSNGTTEDVSLADFAAKGITTTPANGAALTISNTTVTITVDGKNATQPITVNAVTVTGVSVKTPPSKVTYFAGDALNLSGLVVTLYKSNGTTEDVSLADFAAKGITTSPANGATLNTNDKKVTITVNGKKATQPITVNAVTVTGVSVKTPPANVTYYDGELLDLTGLVVTLTKSNGMTEDVALKDFASKGITTDPGNGSALTNTTSKVMITANGQTCWQAITVNQVTVDNVRADRSSLIYTYYYFDIYGDYDEVYITDYLGTKYGGTFTKEEFEAQGYIRTVKMSTTTIKIFVDGVLRFEGIPKLI